MGMAMNVGAAFIFLMAIQAIRFGDKPMFGTQNGATEFGKAQEAEYKGAIKAAKRKTV